MTGYTVHTGTSDEFASGWDRIFGGSQSDGSKKKTAKSQPAKSSGKKKSTTAKQAAKTTAKSRKKS